MQIFRDPNDTTAWIVKPYGAEEAAFVEMLFYALAEKYPDPPPERVIPPMVLKRISETSNPEVALEVVQRLNISEDSQANLDQLYQHCEHAEGLDALQGVVDELVAVKVVKIKYCVEDPRDGHGLEHFDSREDIPETMNDWDDIPFDVTDNDVKIIYVRDPEVFEAGS